MMPLQLYNIHVYSLHYVQYRYLTVGNLAVDFFLARQHRPNGLGTETLSETLDFTLKT